MSSKKFHRDLERVDVSTISTFEDPSLYIADNTLPCFSYFYSLDSQVSEIYICDFERPESVAS